MNLSSREFSDISVQNKWLKMGLGFCGVVIILLFFDRYNADREIVLVPSVVTDGMSVSSKSVSEDYLMYMSKDIAYLLLNVTPATAPSAAKNVQRLIHPESYKLISKQLNTYFDGIENKKISLSFSVLNFDINKDDLIVYVSGYLKTHAGKTEVSSKFKRYEISFARSGTILRLSGFKEVSSE